MAAPWVTRCRDALTRARDAAAAIEPILATMPVELDTSGPGTRLSASAYPPIWQVAPLHVFVVRPSDSAPVPWQTRAMYELGGDHRMARRVDGGVEATISLDGWQPAVADAIIAAIEPALAPCFAP